MPVQVIEAKFEKTATRREEWPEPPLPEFAFVGRSNVGKSSMLNALARQKKLARVSNTPGRTQALQFFLVTEVPSKAAAKEVIRFCDLPGYGYAKVAKSERDRWARMIEDYLRVREPLRAVVLIVDGRHPPSESDHDALRFLQDSGRSVLVAATKLDKLARNRRLAAVRAVERALELPEGCAVPFSAVEGTGTDALWARIVELARG
ncbi:MAG TPA: ribosome biogenesis GTP-binding protein YihA/YsxC [Anaeromyxobacteraceae bacterium]|nr:ribosome biogenesis GTP-binding protein YihA/YsxC [Anaeromyxobacteraceae bacterium]